MSAGHEFTGIHFGRRPSSRRPIACLSDRDVFWNYFDEFLALCNFGKRQSFRLVVIHKASIDDLQISGLNF